MHDIQIEVAGKEHIDPIWEIIKDSFDEPLSKYTAIGQPGYKHYLRDFIIDETPEPKRMLVGLVEGKVSAFVDITVRPHGSNFLTRIAVKPEFRGRGIARLLMSQIHKTHGGGNKWELDVFNTNSGAIRLYKSLGFEVTSTNRWFTRGLTHPTETINDETLNQFPTDLNYLRYGFTNVEIAGHEVSVAGTAVRYHNFDLFMDDLFFAKVKSMYPQVDRLLIVLNQSLSRSPSSERVYEIGRSYRLSGTF